MKLAELRINSKRIRIVSYWEWAGNGWIYYSGLIPEQIGSGFKQTIKRLNQNQFYWACPIVRPDESVEVRSAPKFTFLKSVVIRRNEAMTLQAAKTIRKIRRMSHEEYMRTFVADLPVPNPNGLVDWTKVLA